MPRNTIQLVRRGGGAAPAADLVALHDAITELIRVYQFRDRDRICCHDLSVSQFYALAALITRGPMTLNELAADVGLEKSSASRAVDGLVEAGYLSRQPHPESRRAVRLEATRAGRALYDRIEAASIAEEEQLLADLSPTLRREVTGVLRRLAGAARARLADRSKTCC